MAMDDVVHTPKGQAITFNVRHNDIGNLLVKGWITPGNLPGTGSQYIRHWKRNVYAQP